MKTCVKISVFSLGTLGLVNSVSVSLAESPLVASDGTIGIRAGSKFSSFCLRNKGGKVKLQPCKNKKERYQWQVQGSQIASVFDNKCWEAERDMEGDKIVLSNCDESNLNQHFSFDHGSIMQVHSTEKFCVTLSKSMNLKMKKCVWNRFGGGGNWNKGDKNDDEKDENQDMEHMKPNKPEPEPEQESTTKQLETEEKVTENNVINNSGTDFPMTYDASTEATSDDTFPYIQTEANLGRDAAQCYELVDGFHFDDVSTLKVHQKKLNKNIKKL